MKIDTLKVISTKPTYKEIYKNNNFTSKPIEYTSMTYLINENITVSIEFPFGRIDKMYDAILLDLLDSREEAKVFLKEDSESNLAKRICDLEEILDKHNIKY